MKFKEPSVEYCRQRVLEAQEMADKNDSPGSRDDWLLIVQRWQGMVAQAEAREKAKKSGGH